MRPPSPAPRCPTCLGFVCTPGIPLIRRAAWVGTDSDSDALHDMGHLNCEFIEIAYRWLGLQRDAIVKAELTAFYHIYPKKNCFRWASILDKDFSIGLVFLAKKWASSEVFLKQVSKQKDMRQLRQVSQQRIIIMKFHNLNWIFHQLMKLYLKIHGCKVDRIRSGTPVASYIKYVRSLTETWIGQTEK